MGKLTEIETCDSCPFFDEEGQFCHQVGRKFTDDEFLDKSVIPAWCTLPDKDKAKVK